MPATHVERFVLSRNRARSGFYRIAGGAVAALLIAVAVPPAQAVDGCKLLLCMAGNWRRIEQCEPEVRQALRDVARGRGWPTCGMGGSSGSASQYVAPERCPEQYVSVISRGDDGHAVYSCPYAGVVHLVVDGQPWTRTWWSLTGDSVIEWLPAARAALAGTPNAMDDQFDRDHAAWVLNQTPTSPPDGGGGS